MVILERFGFLVIPVTFCFLLAGCGFAARGGFVMTTWAPISGNSFRVNGPDVADGPFKDRPEAKQTGLMTLEMPGFDPEQVRSADVYLELWGGHPGVHGKRFTLNGEGTYDLPEVGAADHHCVYSYPRVAVDVDQLTPGANELQFACDAGGTFWSHYLIRAAAVELSLDDDADAVADAGLAGFNAAVTARTSDADETIHLSVTVPPALRDRVASVAFQGYYDGYDDNGDTETRDWHGFTKDREPVAFAAIAEDGATDADWDVSMVPDQSDEVQVRAIITFGDAEGLSYRTAPVAVRMPQRDDTVALYGVCEMDKPFWSRAGRAKHARITLPMDPPVFERAVLHFLAWDGGAGGREDYFTINGRQIDVVATGAHDVLYTRAEIDPEILVVGDNYIRLLSDTEHHGIEGILPGPAVVVRCRGN